MKNIIKIMLCMALVLGMTTTVFAQPPRLVDEADLLMDAEEERLQEVLDEISERQQFDVAVVTVNSLEGKSAQDFADDYYDYHGYGMGEGDDGTLLVISMEERDWYVTTHGYGLTAITDAGLSYMAEHFVSDLSEGNYLEAFVTYAEYCDEFVTEARAGAAYDVDHMPKDPRGLKDILIAVVAGLVLALIPMLIMVSKMKNVKKQAEAGSYVDHRSIAITERRDRFMYDSVVKRRIESSSGSGGSSSHRSSSGRSHGGGGGKF